MRTSKRQLHPSRKYILALFALGLLVVLASAFMLDRAGRFNLFHTSVTVSGPGVPTKTLPPHPAANDGNKQMSGSSGVQQQSAVDQHGQAPSTSTPDDHSKWLTSTSGVVTVKLPATGTTFKPGDQVYGSATIPSVQYRLIDDTVGVISQGTINVVHGNFTAAVNFTPNAKTGRLDIFSVDSEGRENNEVQVHVTF